MRRIVGNDRARFASKMVLVGDCWLWTGRTNIDGYGMADVARRSQPAHRAVYELLVGPIPQGLELDHLCRQRDCVAPAHLEPVPHALNVARSPLALATINACKTHCKHGHEFTPENTYVTTRAKRVCRICNNDQARRYRRRLQEAS